MCYLKLYSYILYVLSEIGARYWSLELVTKTCILLSPTYISYLNLTFFWAEIICIPVEFDKTEDLHINSDMASHL